MNAAYPHLLTLFSAACDQPTPRERAAFLDAACGDDTALRARVTALLDAHDRAGGFLEREVAADTPVPDSPTLFPSEEPGALVGPFRLVEKIGEGGMGEVWRGRQDEPLHRDVAVKLIRADCGGGQVLARFAVERQALALMDHPNIAKVFDGGATASGRPYLAMELVDGVPLTRYCDDHQLSLRPRLDLFVAVCQAVQHAHQKGILHRDLKPSNVLVARYDGRPVPKVIDFGTAKAVGGVLAGPTLHTMFGAVIGTPEYMSPEQASLSHDIDTRSDVYALGVLLYELLTGSPPFRLRDHQADAPVTLLTAIREQEPTKPSVRLTTAPDLPALAASRAMEPKKLAAQVRGELDWITLKALEKDRDRRYASAGALAEDVQRYLVDAPVAAGPPSRVYLLGKFVRRHRGALVAAAGMALTVLTAIVGLIVSNVRTERERQQKEKALVDAKVYFDLAREAVDKIYITVAEQMETNPRANSYQRHVLEQALTYYQEFSKRAGDDVLARPEAAVAAYRILRIKSHLGWPGPFGPAGRDAVAAMERLAQERPADGELRVNLTDCHGWLASILDAEGNPQEARKHRRRNLELYRVLAAERPKEPSYRQKIAWELIALGPSASDAPGEVEANLCEAVRLCKQIADELPGQSQHLASLAAAHEALGDFLAKEKRFDRAVEEYGKGITPLAKADRTEDGNSFSDIRARVSHSLAKALRALGRAKEAEAAYRQAVAAAEAQFAKHPEVPAVKTTLVASCCDLAQHLKESNRADEAAPFRRRAVELSEPLIRAKVPEDAWEREKLLQGHNTLDSLLRRAGEWEAAERAARKTLELVRRSAAAAPDDPRWQIRLAGCHGQIALVFRDTRRPKDAAAEWLKAIALYESQTKKHPSQPEFRRLHAWALNSLGYDLRSLPSEREAAADHHRHAIRLCESLVAQHSTEPGYRAELVRSRYALGIVHFRCGRWAEAEATWREALADGKSQLHDSHRELLASLHEDYGWLLATCPDRKLRDPKRAVELATLAVEYDPKRGYWNTLGAVHCAAGNGKEALVALQKSMTLLNGGEGDGIDWLFLARAHGLLEDKEAARRWYDKAAAWIDKHRSKDEQACRLRAEVATALGIKE